MATMPVEEVLLSTLRMLLPPRKAGAVTETATHSSKRMRIIETSDESILLSLAWFI
jgi:hypothetical protein